MAICLTYRDNTAETQRCDVQAASLQLFTYLEIVACICMQPQLNSTDSRGMMLATWCMSLLQTGVIHTYNKRLPTCLPLVHTDINCSCGWFACCAAVAITELSWSAPYTFHCAAETCRLHRSGLHSASPPPRSSHPRTCTSFGSCLVVLMRAFVFYLNTLLKIFSWKALVDIFFSIFFRLFAIVKALNFKKHLCSLEVI